MSDTEPASNFWQQTGIALKAFGKNFLKGALLGVPIGLLAFGMISGLAAIIPETLTISAFGATMNVYESIGLKLMEPFVAGPGPMILFNSIIGGASLGAIQANQAVEDAKAPQIHGHEHAKAPCLENSVTLDQTIETEREKAISNSKHPLHQPLHEGQPHTAIQTATEHSMLAELASKQIH